MSKRHMLVAAAIVMLVTVVLPSVAMAQAAVNEADTNASDVTMWLAITIGFGMSFASASCGYAQSRAVTAACEGMSRNPSASTAIRGSLIIGLVLIESLAIYTLLVSILLIFTFAR